MSNRVPLRNLVVVGEGEEEEEEEEEEQKSFLAKKQIVVVQGEEEECEDEDETHQQPSNNRAPVIIHGEDVEEDEDTDEIEVTHPSKPIENLTSHSTSHHQQSSDSLSKEATTSAPNIVHNSSLNASNLNTPNPSAKVLKFSDGESGTNEEEPAFSDEGTKEKYEKWKETSSFPLPSNPPLRTTPTTITTTTTGTTIPHSSSTGGKSRNTLGKSPKTVQELMPTTDAGRQLRATNQRVRKEFGERIAAQYQTVTKNIRTVESDLKNTLSSVQDITFHTREAIQDLSTIQGDIAVLIHVLSSFPPQQR